MTPYDHNSTCTSIASRSSTIMASISYSCAECGVFLNLRSSYQYPADLYFEAGNRGTLSFSAIDDTKFRFEKEDRIMPFFETLNYWGFQRKRTKLNCASCGKLVGYVYDDGHPATDSSGQFGMGSSQAVPRYPRYRFKIKALKQEQLNGRFIISSMYN